MTVQRHNPAYRLASNVFLIRLKCIKVTYKYSHETCAETDGSVETFVRGILSTLSYVWVLRNSEPP